MKFFVDTDELVDPYYNTFDAAVMVAKRYAPCSIYELRATVKHGEPVVTDLREHNTSPDDPYAVDWAELSSSYNFVATDPDGRRWAFSRCPMWTNEGWTVGHGFCRGAGYSTHNPDWESSLRVRPKV